ncbi:MAG TPA: ABC transporter ATP-binding protein [Natronosporangium sp.]|nr:ABC transporter ATP-binding protein [Natronosporangium sp.]
MIQLVNVSRTFQGRGGAVEALRSIDLSIETGEFVAIVGRSGCGKSTLLRIVAGLIPPTSGEVRVDGTPVTRPRRDLAMVFQKPALLPWRTVLGNVLLPVELLGLRRKEYRERAMELLELVGLADFHRRHPYELSGGMQQRVALCRSLLVEPRALLMDEPFSALDALTREELSVQLQKLHMEQSTTVLFVTHSIDEAILLADRVVVLSSRPGRIKRIIPVDLPRPRTLGRTGQLDEMAQLRAELHELLMTNDDDQPVPAGATAGADSAAA